MHIPEEVTESVFRNAQMVARQVQAVRMNLPRIVDLVYRECKAAITKEVINLTLRRTDNHKVLALEYETLIWRHTSGAYCLVCSAQPDNSDDAKKLLQRQFCTGRESCAFCGLAEASYAPLELVEARDPVGRALSGILVHRNCLLQYQRLNRIAELPDRQPQKDSLI